MTTEKLFNKEEFESNMNCLTERIMSRDTIDTAEALELMELFQFTRVADALEDIASKMEHLCNSVELLEELSDCVDEPLPLVGGSQFCVKGNID